MKNQTIVQVLRIVGVLEAFSWLALLITMYLKYAQNMPEYNMLTGRIHGFLFIIFVVLVLVAGIKMKWSMKEITLSLLSSVVPFGTLWADAKIFKKYQN